MPDMIQICSECNRPIEDQFVMRVADSILHEQCLRCFTCGHFLTESCFSKFGQFYCRQDFYSLFGPRCSGCQLVFSETEKVRKIDKSLFHGHCFKCKDCAKDLSEAEKVGCDQNGNLLCESDFLKLNSEEENLANSTSLDDCEEDKKDENMMEKGNEPTSEEEPDLNKETMDDGKGKRKRGPKTTIKPHQLEVLKNCFDQNPKPTPKVFEELSKDTGLTKRVIQVWFQNKRSKRKRISKMQSIINLGQSFPTPLPGLGYPPPHPWDGRGGPGDGLGGLVGPPCGDLGSDFPPHPGGYPGLPYSRPEHDGRNFERPFSGYGGPEDGMAGPAGYLGSGSVHFYPSPPSQTSDYPNPSPGGPQPGGPGGNFSGPPLPSFPSPGMEAPFPQD